MKPWTPRGTDPEDHHALVDGVPIYMRDPLREWFYSEFTHTPGRAKVWNTTRVQQYDLQSRSASPLIGIFRDLGPRGLFEQLSPDDQLRVIEWTVYDNSGFSGGVRANRALEEILQAGGSLWKVGEREGLAGLERRVPEGVQDAAEAAMSTPGLAGTLLSEAWHAAFGRDPQPDVAYRKAIEAVEAAVLPKVAPNDGTATLGKAIGQMRTMRDWALPFVKEHAENPSGAVVINMLQALWSGHSDRHPGTSAYVPSTQEPAEVAVLMAVPLVHWFSTGTVGRRPAQP